MELRGASPEFDEMSPHLHHSSAKTKFLNAWRECQITMKKRSHHKKKFVKVDCSQPRVPPGEGRSMIKVIHVDMTTVATQYVCEIVCRTLEHEIAKR